MKGTLEARRLERLNQSAVAVFRFHHGVLADPPCVHKKGVNAPLGVIYFVETGVTPCRIIAEIGVRKARPYCFRHGPWMSSGQPGLVTLEQVQAVYPHLFKLLKSLGRARGYRVWAIKRRVAPKMRRSWMFFPTGLTIKIHEKDKPLLRLFEELEILPENPLLWSKLGRIRQFINGNWHLGRDKGKPESFYAFSRFLKEKPKSELRILLRTHVLGILAGLVKDGGAFLKFLRVNGHITTEIESWAELIANRNLPPLQFAVLPDKALHWKVRAGDGLPVLFRYKLGPLYSVRVGLLPWETEALTDGNNPSEGTGDPFGLDEFVRSLTAEELASLGAGD